MANFNLSSFLKGSDSDMELDERSSRVNKKIHIIGLIISILMFVVTVVLLILAIIKVYSINSDFTAKHVTYTKNRWVFYGVLLLTSVPGFFFCASNDYFSSFGMLLGFILAEPFEEKFVKFENTSNIFRCILRTISGGLIYFGLNAALKLPFPKPLLDAGGFVSHLIRMLRYAVVIFTVIGVYPMLFKLTGKLWNRKRSEPQTDAPDRTAEQEPSETV